MLDNKALFSDYARSLGLSVPEHHVVTSPQQLMKLNSQQVRRRRLVMNSQVKLHSGQQIK